MEVRRAHSGSAPRTRLLPNLTAMTINSPSDPLLRRSVCAASQPACSQVSRCVGLSGSDREFPALTGRSGTQRARPFRLCSGSCLDTRYGRSSDDPLLVGHGAGLAWLPEKRKVGSSTLPLTTSFGLLSSALTRANANWVLSCPQLSSDHDCPCVTVVGRSLSHADRTSRLRVPGSWPPVPCRGRPASGPGRLPPVLAGRAADLKIMVA